MNEIQSVFKEENMKKLQTIALEKILLFCGFSLALTVIGFWEFQSNVSMSEKLARVQTGLSTCFSRVNQTFTAAMIKDYNGPYLKRDFMALTDECLKEGSKAAGVDMSTLPKASVYFNELLSEVHWFHEKVVKVVGAQAGGVEVPMNAINEKFMKIEELKLDLTDQLDGVHGQYREARLRDELLVAAAFMMFMGSLFIFGLKELALLRHRREMEHKALSLLNTGSARAAAMVDQLVQKALAGQGMPVTAQVFNDYHTTVLEQMSFQPLPQRVKEQKTVEPAAAVIETTQAEVAELAKPEESSVDIRKLLTNQALRLKASMEVQDGEVSVDPEVLAQVIQAFGQRLVFGDLKLHGVRSSDRYEVKLQATNLCFNVHELNYIADTTSSMEGVDVNVLIAMDLIRDHGLEAQVKNRLGNDGAIIGAEVVIALNANPNRTLVNVVKGKKRDLQQRLSEVTFN
jgi:hypothetical protein